MAQLHRLPCRDEDGNLRVVVEAPRGSLVKTKYEPALDAIVMSRPLPLGIAYPFDWGFVPSTKADDGDPLDALIIADYGTWPGVVVPTRIIGVVRVSQREKARGKVVRNDRLVVVPDSDDRYDDVRDLGKRLRSDLEQFFVIVGSQTHFEVVVDGWDGVKKATALLEAAAVAYG